jgi:hypothetical protein
LDSALQVGDFKLSPFRAGQLPFGWYHANGDRYPVESPQGQALIGLPAEYKADWGVVVEDGAVNLPTAYNAAGDGMFPRPVDGSTRQVGSAQGDAMRNFAGQDGCMHQRGGVNFPKNSQMATITGPYSINTVAFTNTIYVQGANSNSDMLFLTFDPSLVVPTAAENRPVNVGMTLAVYLGV